MDNNTHNQGEFNSPLSFYNKLNKNVFSEVSDSVHDKDVFEDKENINYFSDSEFSPNTHDAFNSLKHNHSHHKEECECGCSHKHNDAHNSNAKQDYKMYDLDEDFDENEDYFCDIDPSKICDNCGKCLNYYNTDKKGYIEIPIDKVDTSNSNVSLEDLLKLYGFDDDEN